MANYCKSPKTIKLKQSKSSALTNIEGNRIICASERSLPLPETAPG